MSVTPSKFRKLALSFSGSEEGEHQGHPDFRVGGKIFATLGPGPKHEWGMLKLPLEMQDELIARDPETFEPSPGAWGRQGCTKVMLASVDPSMLKQGLRAAWEKHA